MSWCSATPPMRSTISSAWMKATAGASSVYTLESHIFYLQEIGEGEELVVRTQVLGADAKRVRLFHSMYHGEQGDLLATSELMLLHVDTSGPRAAPFAPGIRTRLDSIAEAHAELPRPTRAGRSINL